MLLSAVRLSSTAVSAAANRTATPRSVTSARLTHCTRAALSARRANEVCSVRAVVPTPLRLLSSPQLTRRCLADATSRGAASGSGTSTVLRTGTGVGRPSSSGASRSAGAARPTAPLSLQDPISGAPEDWNAADFLAEGDHFNSSQYPEALIESKMEPYQGIAQEAFPAETRAILERPVAGEDIEIRPDGMLYLPEIKYRRTLNAAFGAGAWALMPRPGTVINVNRAFSREYALYCLGRFAASARGEQAYQDADTMSFGNVEEGAKSNALMRCCKDLGIASELWDPIFIQQWKAQHAVEAWVENATSGARRKLWRRRDRVGAFAWPWREVDSSARAGGSAAPALSTTSTSTTTTALPSSTSASTLSQAKPSSSSAPSETYVSSTKSTRTSDKASAAAPTTATTKGDEVNASEEGSSLDITDKVPANMKKYAGKTFLEVAQTESGRQYLKWASEAKNFPSSVRNAAAKALQAWEQLDESTGSSEVVV